MPLSEEFFIPTFILINILSMMNRFKILLLWGYFILGSFSFAQTSPDLLSTFYREDQFYFGVSFMGLINAIPFFSKNRTNTQEKVILLTKG